MSACHLDVRNVLLRHLVPFQMLGEVTADRMCNNRLMTTEAHTIATSIVRKIRRDPWEAVYGAELLLLSPEATNDVAVELWTYYVNARDSVIKAAIGQAYEWAKDKAIERGYVEA